MKEGGSALILGFGPPEEGEGGASSGPALMRALRRALREGDDEAAFKAFSEAVHVCDDEADEGGDDYGDDEDEGPLSFGGGRRKDKGDEGGGLSF